jgi:ribulose-phosphate 3-epimerase
MQIIDGITVMSVDPGKARQNFLPKVLGKIKTLRNRYPELSIQIDGGMHIGPVNTIEQALLAGANEIVCGSEIFLSTDIPKKIDQLYQIINK